MKLKGRLKAAACAVGLFVYGPLIVGLSLWGLVWSARQDKSLPMLILLAGSLVCFIIGCVVIALTAWLWYEIYAEAKRTRAITEGQLPEPVDMAGNVHT